MELKKYIIRKIEYLINEKAEKAGAAEYTPKIEILVNPKNNTVDISVKIDDEDMPFNIEVCIIGYYEFNNMENNHEIMLKNNGVAILMPYIRAIISQITSMAGLGTLTIPIINVKEMNEKAKEDYVKI